MKVMEFEIEKTEFGLPAAWEAGGGLRNVGTALIIARPDGGAPEAVDIRREGDLALSTHALIVVSPGFYIVDVSRWDNHRKGRFTVRILRIRKIVEDDHEPDGLVAITDVVKYNANTMDEAIALAPPPLARAVEAAVKKSLCYRCCEPHYVREPHNEKTKRRKHHEAHEHEPH